MFAKESEPLFLFYNIIICTFVCSKYRDMGLGSYWVRKDDQTGEAKTIKPWEEDVSNGDKRYPDPHKKGQKEKEQTPDAK